MVSLFFNLRKMCFFFKYYQKGVKSLEEFKVYVIGRIKTLKYELKL